MTDETDVTGLIERLQSSQRKGNALIHALALKGSSKTTLRRMVDVANDAADMLESLQADVHNAREAALANKNLAEEARAALEASQRECLEQARLNGMGSEREASLHGEITRLRKDVARLEASQREADAKMREAVIAERARCAKIADAKAKEHDSWLECGAWIASDEIAAAIRSQETGDTQ